MNSSICHLVGAGIFFQRKLFLFRQKRGDSEVYLIRKQKFLYIEAPVCKNSISWFKFG